MGGSSLETFSGEAQLKKSPCTCFWPMSQLQGLLSKLTGLRGQLAASAVVRLPLASVQACSLPGTFGRRGRLF